MPRGLLSISSGATKTPSSTPCTSASQAVEIGQRARAFRHQLHQIRPPAQQAEAPARPRLHRIRQRDSPNPGMMRRPWLDLHAGIGQPVRLGRRAAAGHGAGFGRTVDLEHRGLPVALHRLGHARCQRRRRRDDRRERGGRRRSASRARRCSGVVISSRRGGRAASESSTSEGKKLSPAWVATAACSGSMIVVSKPYMCCGGTVARMLVGAPSPGRRPNRSAAAAAPATSAPQGFGCARRRRRSSPR